MATNSTIFTIGHSNHSAEDFLQLLYGQAIRVVVDVRSAPYSRFAPQFNQTQLQVFLREHNIDYRFAGETLGGRPADPSCYFNGIVPQGRADYLNLVDYRAVARQEWYRRGITRLMEIASEHATAIMCSEEDPMQCHRHHLITQSLQEAGVEVLHIRKGGTIEPARSSDEAMQLSFLGQS